jgi:hypothetical protein
LVLCPGPIMGSDMVVRMKETPALDVERAAAYWAAGG